MALQIIPKEQQGYGEFNQGEIKENKPVGFPQDGGKIKPFSNLFYWSHAWTEDVNSQIGEHPHQGFEIMSFVLDGHIDHYDTIHGTWKGLQKGDVQIMRAGNGLSHSEIFRAGTSMFQIWLDPDLAKTLSKPASYNDYRAADFPVEVVEGITRKTYVGEGAPVELDTPGVTIRELSFPEGEYEFWMDKEAFHAFYLIEGEISLDGEPMTADSFALSTKQDKVKITGGAKRLFYIECPLRPPYLTYIERMQMQMRQQA